MAGTSWINCSFLSLGLLTYKLEIIVGEIIPRNCEILTGLNDIKPVKDLALGPNIMSNKG